LPGARNGRHTPTPPPPELFLDAAVCRHYLGLMNPRNAAMKLPVIAIIGVVVLSAAVQGCCCHLDTKDQTWQWAPNPTYPDFETSGAGATGVGTVKVRLVAVDPQSVTYWRDYGTASFKEVVAYLGVVEVGRTQFNPGDTGVLEFKLPPGKYWLRLAGNSLTVKMTDEGREKTLRFPDREATVPVEVVSGRTRTVTVDYGCMGMPFFAAL
jgi:hypothetical protein